MVVLAWSVCRSVCRHMAADPVDPEGSGRGLAMVDVGVLDGVVVCWCACNWRVADPEGSDWKRCLIWRDSCGGCMLSMCMYVCMLSMCMCVCRRKMGHC